MKYDFAEGVRFDRIDFTKERLPKGEYEHCRFTGCDFSGSDMRNVQFAECEFADCNLSMAKVADSAFMDIRFVGCKILGVRFDECNPIGLSVGFDSCIIDHSSFYQMKLRSTIFRKCRFHESDFSECDLTGSLFDDCDLMGAMFNATNFERADLRTAYNYSIDPAQNRVKKAKFSLHGIPGLLTGYDIIIE